MLPSKSIVRVGDDPLATFCFLLPPPNAINRRPNEQAPEEMPSTPLMSPSESQPTKPKKQRKKKIPESEESSPTEKSGETEMEFEKGEPSKTKRGKKAEKTQPTITEYKGPYPLEWIVGQSITTNKYKKRTVKSILKWIYGSYPQTYTQKDLSWQKQVRHMLTRNPNFERTQRLEG